MALPSANSSVKKTIFVEILGLIFTFEIPADIDNSSVSLFKGTGDDGKISCSCLSPSNGTCPKKDKLVATYCDASNCQSCKMSGAKVVDQNGLQQQITIDDNNFIRF